MQEEPQDESNQEVHVYLNYDKTQYRSMRLHDNDTCYELKKTSLAWLVAGKWDDYAFFLINWHKIEGGVFYYQLDDYDYPLLQLQTIRQQAKVVKSEEHQRAIKKIKNMVWRENPDYWDLFFLPIDNLNSPVEEVQTEGPDSRITLFDSLKSRKIYERKGQLWKKEPSDEWFVQHMFVLINDSLYFYKDDRWIEEQLTVIPLTGARLTTHKMEKKFAFEIQSSWWRYCLAAKSLSDQEDWMFKIQTHITTANSA